MVTNQRLESAMNYLAMTDESCAKARALQLYLEAKEKTILAIQMLDQTGTVQEKDARARTSDSYLQWLEDYRNAVADFELQRNKRRHAELLVEVWRSENANSRRGNV